MGAIKDLAIQNITDPLNKQNTAAKLREVLELIDTEIELLKGKIEKVTLSGGFGQITTTHGTDRLYLVQIYFDDGGMYRIDNDFTIIQDQTGILFQDTSGNHTTTDVYVVIKPVIGAEGVGGDIYNL